VAAGISPDDGGGDLRSPRGLIRLTGVFAAGSSRSARCRWSRRAKSRPRIVDRNGKLLRAYAMADGRWRLPVDAKTDVDPGYLKLLLAYEDKRFYVASRRRSAGARRAPRCNSSRAATSSPAARPSRCNWRG
jgi:hypothetical protein